MSRFEPQDTGETADRPGLLGRLARRLVRSTLVRDERGATAVEFGIIALPFIALMGASSFELAGTFIVSLIILMFYARKMHERQSHSMDNHTASNAQ